MKKPLLLAAFLLGNASAVNLSELSTEDVCYRDVIRLQQDYPNYPTDYFTPFYSIGVKPLLDAVGFTNNGDRIESGNCKYRLDSYATFYVHGAATSNKPRIAVILHVYLSSQAILSREEFNISNGYIVSTDIYHENKAINDVMLNKLINATYNRFIEDWIKAHK